MKVVILAAGTRGDIDPFLALALGMKAAGHGVMVWVPPTFEPKVRRLGLRTAPPQANADPFEPLRPTKGDLLGAHLRGELHVLHQMMAAHWNACRGADLVVYHGNLFSVPMIAEKLRLPRVAVLQAPILTPTGAFPCPLYEGEAVGAEENLATYARVFSELTGGIRPLVRAWRTRRLGLPAEEDGALPFLVRDALPSPILYCSSPALYGRPDDWPETSLASGFWLHEDPNEAELDPALLRFLEAGPPPVYVGFGSMRREGARELSLQVASVLERLGLRGVLATGWGGLGRIANRQHLRCIGRVSHRRLFPRVAAVVHHGGASTTGAGLLAARPTWILPFLADQPFWGRRVHALGLGPAPLPQSELDETALAAGLEAVARDPAFRQRAARMGERLRHEEGIEDAVRFVETYAAV